MPFKSKAQSRYFHWAENHGKLPSGTAEEWAADTPEMRDLPERVKPSGKPTFDSSPRRYRSKPGTRFSFNGGLKGGGGNG